MPKFLLTQEMKDILASEVVQVQLISPSEMAMHVSRVLNREINDVRSNPMDALQWAAFRLMSVHRHNSNEPLGELVLQVSKFLDANLPVSIGSVGEVHYRHSKDFSDFWISGKDMSGFSGRIKKVDLGKDVRHLGLSCYVLNGKALEIGSKLEMFSLDEAKGWANKMLPVHINSINETQAEGVSHSEIISSVNLINGAIRSNAETRQPLGFARVHEIDLEVDVLRNTQFTGPVVIAGNGIPYAFGVVRQRNIESNLTREN